MALETRGAGPCDLPVVAAEQPRLTAGAEAVAGRAQVWGSNRMLPPPAAQEGGPAVFALQAAAQAAGSPLLRMTSDESIRAAVNAASALDDPLATPQALLARLQVLQAQARHASQTTRLNTCARAPPPPSLIPRLLAADVAYLCHYAASHRCIHSGKLVCVGHSTHSTHVSIPPPLVSACRPEAVRRHGPSGIEGAR